MFPEDSFGSSRISTFQRISSMSDLQRFELKTETVRLSSNRMTRSGSMIVYRASMQLAKISEILYFLSVYDTSNPKACSIVSR